MSPACLVPSQVGLQSVSLASTVEYLSVPDRSSLCGCGSFGCPECGTTVRCRTGQQCPVLPLQEGGRHTLPAFTMPTCTLSLTSRWVVGSSPSSLGRGLLSTSLRSGLGTSILTVLYRTAQIGPHPSLRSFRCQPTTHLSPIGTDLDFGLRPPALSK